MDQSVRIPKYLIKSLAHSGTFSLFIYKVFKPLSKAKILDHDYPQYLLHYLILCHEWWYKTFHVNT